MDALLLIRQFLVLFKKSEVAFVQHRIVRVTFVRRSLVNDDSVGRLLVEKMFVLDDTCEINLLSWVIYDRVGLIVPCIHDSFDFKVNGPVLEFLKALICKVVVDGPCVDDGSVISDLRSEFEEISVEPHVDQIVVQHAAKELGVAIARQDLVFVAKVPGVKVVSTGNPCKNGLVECLWVPFPLFIRVMAEDFLIKRRPDPRLGHLLAVFDLRVLDARFLEPGVHFLDGLNLLVANHIHGGDVGRDRTQLSVDHAENLVLPALPAAEPRDKVEHALRICVKEMGPVLVHSDAGGRVDVVVAVSSNVVALLDDKHALLLLLGKPPGDHSAREAASDDDYVVVFHICREISSEGPRLASWSCAKILRSLSVLPRRTPAITLCLFDPGGRHRTCARLWPAAASRWTCLRRGVQGVSIFEWTIYFFRGKIARAGSTLRVCVSRSVEGAEEGLRGISMSVDDICALIALQGSQALVSTRKKKRKARDRALRNPILVRNVNPNVKDDMVEETFKTCGHIKSMVRYKEDAAANMMHKFIIHFEKATGQMAAVALMKKGLILAGCPLEVVVPTPEEMEDTRNAHKRFKKAAKQLKIKASKAQQDAMQAADPINPEDIEYTVGQQVEVVGLAKKPEFNGLVGTVSGEKTSDGRWPVLLPMVRPGKAFNLRAQNIRASWADRERAKKQLEHKRRVQKKRAKQAQLPNWTCPVCRNDNYGWRKKCNKCKRLKPESIRRKQDQDRVGMRPPSAAQKPAFPRGNQRPGATIHKPAQAAPKMDAKSIGTAAAGGGAVNNALARALAKAKEISAKLNRFE